MSGKDLDVDFNLDEAAVNADFKPTVTENNDGTNIVANIEPHEDAPGAKNLVKQKRLTIDLDPELHKQLKIAAIAQGTTMVKLVRKWIIENT